ncbi:MAG TPA: tyrosine-protein phosphatase, partial [Ilumatobacter sp.]|nr:tyrosine-protein phosphatase [Ilumatobacter sp.]
MSELAGVRLIRFEGATNFRDIGGYPSELGGQVRWGVLYRAGRLDRLTASDLEDFRALDIRTVFDLRREDEREQWPDPMPNVHLCLMSKVQAKSPLPHAELLVEHDHGVQFMRELYSGLLAHAAAEIGSVFTTLAAPDAMPAVFHCAVGKDRTGLVAALLLTWLGVDRETVLDDFELSDAHVGQAQRDELVRRMADRGIGPEAAAGILGASRESMQDTLDELDTRYGGADNYLREHCGVDHDA